MGAVDAALERYVVQARDDVCHFGSPSEIGGRLGRSQAAAEYGRRRRYVDPICSHVQRRPRHDTSTWAASVSNSCRTASSETEYIWARHGRQNLRSSGNADRKSAKNAIGNGELAIGTATHHSLMPCWVSTAMPKVSGAQDTA